MNETRESNEAWLVRGSELAYIGARFVFFVSGERRGLQQRSKHRVLWREWIKRNVCLYLAINGSGVGERFVESAKSHGHCDRACLVGFKSGIYIWVAVEGRWVTVRLGWVRKRLVGDLYVCVFFWGRYSSSFVIRC